MPELSTDPQDHRWRRLRAMLRAVRPERTVTIGHMVERTGLTFESVEMVLEALTRAGLFVRLNPAKFRRARLLTRWGSTQKQERRPVRRG